MPDDAMPADPFREGLADWDPLAAGCAGLFSALVAHGMSEPNALELTGRYLHLMLSAMIANSLQAAQERPGEPA
jgi:hypothetical protein